MIGVHHEFILYSTLQMFNAYENVFILFTNNIFRNQRVSFNLVIAKPESRARSRNIPTKTPKLSVTDEGVLNSPISRSLSALVPLS